MERNLSRLIRLIASTTAVCLFCTQAFANPQGGVVSSGQASITSSGNRVDVHQASDRALIDWRTFDIAPGEVTQFHQPSPTSLTVNRVTAAAPSQIDGQLTANGHLVLINPNGIVFGQGSAVDVNGLVATTSDIDASTLYSSKLEFRTPGNPDARVVNEGVITAKDAGLVGLVAPHVENRGVIDARLGKVQLASGDTFTLDLYGDGLINVAVSDPVSKQLVSNSGLLRADGGTVSMTAAAGRDIVDSVLNMDGVIQARSIGEKNGKIVLFAEGSNAVKGNAAGDKGKKQGNSTVLVSGMLDASGTDAITTRPTAGVKGTTSQAIDKGERGGSIDVFGDQIAILNGTSFDVSGLTGETNTTGNGLLSDHRPTAAGGSIRIGGDYLGQGDTPAAKSLFVDTYTLFYADALHSGDAGRVIFWSDGDTDFRGNVYGRGGLFGGNGGFVETSGKDHLSATGFVDLTASEGQKGTYLLDPADITIYGNVDPAFVSTDGTIDLAGSLKLWLDASDTTKVQLTYSTDGLSGATASGTAGSNTLTTSANVSASLAPGARIRLGTAGAVTTADTVGADTYTIASISGTTITLTSNLTQNYAGSTLHRGLVSQLTDKSGQGNNATQSTATNMPLWVSNGQNGLGIAQFDGTADYLFHGFTGDPGSLFAAGDTNTSSLFRTIFGARSSAAGATDAYYFQVGNPSRTPTFARGVGTENGGATDFVSVYGAQLGSNSPFIMSGTNDNTTIRVFANGDPGAPDTRTGPPKPIDGPATFGAGYFNDSVTDFWQGKIYEGLLYSSLLVSTSRHLIEQYQSAKWGIALTPPGTGSTEVQKATAADGYSVFTTRYLERLSQSADISLQATNNITLDLKGDNLSLASGRSLSMTAGNDIRTQSAGTVAVSGAGTVSFTAGRDIVVDHALTMNAGSGLRSFTATRDITFNAAVGGTGSNGINTSAGRDLTINAPFTIPGGTISLAGTGGTGNISINANVVGSGHVQFQAANDISVSNATLLGRLRLFASNGNSNGTTGRLYLTNAVLNTGGDGLYLTSGSNAGTRPDFVLDTTSVPATPSDLTLAGFNNLTLSRPLVMSGANPQISATGTLTFNEDFSFGSGAGQAFAGLSGIVLNANITKTGSGGNLTFSGPLTVSGNRTVSVAGGNLSINGAVNGTTAGADSLTTASGTGTTTFASAVGAVTPLNNLSITADALTLGGNAFGTGALSLQPATASQPVNLNNGTAGFALDTSEIGRIQTGWSVVAIGRADASGLTTIGSATWNAPVTVRSGAGNISVTGTQTLGGNSLLLTTAGSTGDISVAANVTGTGPGTQFTVVTGDTFDGTGGTFTGTGGGRFLVYAPNTASLTPGGFSNDFRRFSCTFGGACPTLSTGNGFLYSTTPVLDVTPSALPPIVAGSPIPNLIGYAYTLAGYLGGDATADTVTGSLTGSTPYTTSSAPGTYAVNHAGGTLASALGYAFNYLSNASAVSAVLNPGGFAPTPTPVPPAPTEPDIPSLPPVVVVPTPPVIPVDPTPPVPAAPVAPPAITVLPSVVGQAVTQAPPGIPDVNRPAPASTLTAELSGEAIVLTPTNRSDTGSTVTEDENNNRGESVPCPSASPYDPACHSAAAPAR